MQQQNLDGVFARYNVLSAFARSASYALTVPVVAAFPGMPILFLAQTFARAQQEQDFVFPFEPMLHSATLFCVLFFATRITSRSELIPLILQQINFGEEIDWQRWCLAWSTSMDRASIRVFGSGTELSSQIVVKALWAVAAATFATLAQARRS